MVPNPSFVQSSTATESFFEPTQEYASTTTLANLISSVLTTDKSTESSDVISTVSELTTSWISNLTTAAIEICTPPAYHEFPPDAFTNTQRAYGGFLVHVLVVLYMFVALAIVCDDYFVTSLDKICEKLGFSEDVAGATFMAAGSSAPELFTALIGVFVTKGDVGVGTIVGSAVFNILFVIGLCGLLAGQVVVLSWWPMCRDSVYYALAVVVLILVVYDGEVTWYESLIMLLLYGLYILLMRYNVSLQAWVVEKVHQLRNAKHVKMMNGAVLKTMRTDYEAFEDEDDDVFSDHMPSPIAMKKPPEMGVIVDEYVKNTQFNITFSEGGFMILLRAKHLPAKTRFRHAAWLVISYRQRMLRDDSYSRRQKFKTATNRLSVVSYTKSARNWFSMTYEAAENFDQWKQKPNSEDGFFALIKWVLMYPIRIALYFTIPDCRKTRWEKYFMATFLLSILWIAIFSYITVWMVTLIGVTFSIPDSVMGITFLAAGTSIPDAMASVFVAKQGMGDMAVSNSIGSNVFDILLGLSLPWFIKTAMVSPGTVVRINSNGMLYSIILLFLTVVIAVGSIRASGWTLTKKNSILCLIVYAIYLAISSMTECNVFGYVNPPMCKE